MSMQQMIVRTLMQLPAPLLRRMSKAVPLEIDGRALDPGLGFLTAQAAKGPPLDTQTPHQARAATRAAFAMMNAKRARNVGVTDFAIPQPSSAQSGGTIAARHYWPVIGGSNPALVVYYHMGGCVIGDLDACDSFCARMASTTGAGVISIDYRLAPEHVYPAAVEDAVAAFRWVRDNAGRFGGTAERIAVGGDSAGGLLSTHVAQEMRNAGEQGPKVQLLIYPWVDMTAEGGSMVSCANCVPLGTAGLEWFAHHYLPDGTDTTDARVSPGLADELSGLPKALVYTAGFDPLRDQGEAYARRLEAAGVPVVFREYGDMPHAFTAMGGVSARAAQVADEIIDDLDAALKTPS